MKKALLILAAFAALEAFCADLGAESSSTNRVVTSKIVTEPAWKRDVVTVDELGQIHNDSGKIAQTAETEAVNEVARRAGEVSDAAKSAMNSALEELLRQTNGMATAGLGLALSFPPCNSYTNNLVAYVVKTETTNGVTDVQWVHYNYELSLAPNRTVVYETYGQQVKVAANWGEWDSKGETITVAGKTWHGCHRCTVARPAWAQGKSCLDIPNETWGGENGMTWGDMVLTHGGVPYFTGVVSNNADRVVARFDNGYLVELTPYNE